MPRISVTYFLIAAILLMCLLIAFTSKQMNKNIEDPGQNIIKSVKAVLTDNNLKEIKLNEAVDGKNAGKFSVLITLTNNSPAKLVMLKQSKPIFAELFSNDKVYEAYIIWRTSDSSNIQWMRIGYDLAAVADVNWNTVDEATLPDSATQYIQDRMLSSIEDK